MTCVLRKHAILLALLLLAGQLVLGVHATVHKAEYNCQLCFSQAHHSAGIPPAKLTVPPVEGVGTLIPARVNACPPVSPCRAFFQRAPPVTA